MGIGPRCLFRGLWRARIDVTLVGLVIVSLFRGRILSLATAAFPEHEGPDCGDDGQAAEYDAEDNGNSVELTVV